jgi:hypothetical protein
MIDEAGNLVGNGNLVFLPASLFVSQGSAPHLADPENLNHFSFSLSPPLFILSRNFFFLNAPPHFGEQ